jgi:hypothetical protein
MKRLISSLGKTNIVLEYLETNGSPLVTDTIPKLKEFKSAGLNCLLLSISPFHNEFIPVGRVMHIIQSIVSVFGREGIFPWHPGYLNFLQKVSLDKPVPLERYFNAFSSSEILQQLSSIMYIHPGGRAAYFLAKYLPCYPAEALLDKICKENLQSPVHAHIDCQGNYLTGFCSGLRIGKETALNLDSLYGRGIRLSEYPILEILVRHGVKGLYQFGLSSGYTPKGAGYVSPCHLCLDLRLHLYFDGKTYEELYPSFFYEDLRSS